MSSGSHFDDLFRRAAWVVPLLAVAGLLLLWRSYTRLPAVPPEQAAPVAMPAPRPAAERPVAAPALDWSVIQSHGDAAHAPAGSLAARFRLAGTFFAFGSDADPDSRKAVLDDSRDKAQRIVSEGDSIEDITVARIQRDRVLLRTAGGQEVELRLAFTGGAGGPKAGGADSAAGAGAAGGAAAWLGGESVGPNRWSFNRQKLIDYYAELRDQPERMVKVFDSLKPVYDAERRITGYQLGIEGEQPFFDAAGLREGDVVRSVNSMKMSNRRRAEYLIREFVEDRSNVFVFDIERGGKPERLVYEVH